MARMPDKIDAILLHVFDDFNVDVGERSWADLINAVRENLARAGYTITASEEERPNAS